MDAPLNIIEVALGVLMDRLDIDATEATIRLIDQAAAFRMPIEKVADIVCKVNE